jgi:hypothetical protein
MVVAILAEPAAGVAEWGCVACTYLNVPANSACEMCNTPRPPTTSTAAATNAGAAKSEAMDEDKAGADGQTTELQSPHAAAAAAAEEAKGDADAGGEEGKARQEEPSLGLARHLEPAEKLYLALALSRILRANLASCLRRDLAFDVLGLDTLRDTEGSPQLALQLLRTLYRFAEAYERSGGASEEDHHRRSRLPRDLLHAVGRQMAETAAILLQTEFRPATAALLLDLLRPSSSSSSFSSSSPSAAATQAEAGAHSLLLTMFLADACSTSLSALDATLFACPAAPPAAATTATATIGDCDFRRPLQARAQNADDAENTVDRAADAGLVVAVGSDSRPPPAASALSPTQQPQPPAARRRLSRGGATAGDHMQTEGDNKEEAEEAEEAAGASSNGSNSNAVVEAALTLLARDMERAVPPTTPEAACLWSPVGPELLSLQFLKLYQHRALTALALPPRAAATADAAATTPAAVAPPSASLAYFAFYGSHPTEPATAAAAAAATPHNEWDLPRDDAARLKVEAELHHYLRRLLALSLASLSALAASLPASEAEEDPPAEARRVHHAVAAMHATATGQLLLPFLRLASRKQLACPLFLKPLSTLLRPLRALHAFLLRYRHHHHSSPSSSGDSSRV